MQNFDFSACESETQQQALIDECGFKTADKYADLRKMQDKHNLLSVKLVKLPQRAAQIHTEDLKGQLPQQPTTSISCKLIDN